MKLTDRLLKIADLVTKGKKIADIGTDHGYIPVYLLNKGHVDFAILADVNKGPLENARSEVRHNNLTDKVDLRLGSGIEVLNENEVDEVIIAGMGGILISEILEAGKEKLSHVNRLILQPNNHEESLRQWLVNHQFVIKKEEILLEAGKFYEIIVAEPLSKLMTEKLSVNDLTFGPFLSKEKSTVFQQKWQKELNTLNKIIARLPEEQAEKRQEVLNQIARIEEVLR